MAGDIIGIHNHGQLSIGDTLTEGAAIDYHGIPCFAPECFRTARPRDPLKGKPLATGLRELGEEGAVQVFERQAADRCCSEPSARCSSRSSRIDWLPNTVSTRSTSRRRSQPRGG